MANPGPHMEKTPPFLMRCTHTPLCCHVNFPVGACARHKPMACFCIQKEMRRQEEERQKEEVKSS